MEKEYSEIKRNEIWKTVTDKTRTPSLVLKKTRHFSPKTNCKQTPRAVATLPAPVDLRSTFPPSLSASSGCLLPLQWSLMMQEARKVRGSCNLHGCYPLRPPDLERPRESAAGNVLVRVTGLSETLSRRFFSPEMCMTVC